MATIAAHTASNEHRSAHHRATAPPAARLGGSQDERERRISARTGIQSAPVGWLRRRAARRRLREVAERIGARDGVVIHEKCYGGGLMPLVLGIVTLRPGTEQDVGQAQIDAALAAGYSREGRAPCVPGRPCVFLAAGGLPMMSIETYPAGKSFPSHGVVPDGLTGVVVSING